MKKIIRKILKEDQRERYLDKIVQVMDNDFPLYHNLNLYGFYDQLSGDELNYVFSGIFGKPVIINKNFGIYFFIYDENGNTIYLEDLNNGKWNKKEYDKNGRNIYYEHSDGYWYKYEYDENGNQIYSENSDGLIRDYR